MTSFRCALQDENASRCVSLLQQFETLSAERDFLTSDLEAGLASRGFFLGLWFRFGFRDLIICFNDATVGRAGGGTGAER